MPKEGLCRRKLLVNLCAIHHIENSNCVNKWLISAAASASISVGGGMFQILESIWLERKIWREAKVQNDVIKIVAKIQIDRSKTLQVANAYIF